MFIDQTHTAKTKLKGNHKIPIDHLIESLLDNRNQQLIKNENGDDLSTIKKVDFNQVCDGDSEFISHKNHFYHKLIRIHEEFQFVKNNTSNYQKLTKREKQIIRLLVKGHNNPEIGDILFISRFTVAQHRKHINRKLQIKSFAHLMTYSYAFNMV